MSDESRLSIVDLVVQDLVARTGVNPDNLMIIGAEARDHLHHHVHGSQLPVRGTRDVDIALAVNRWADYEAVTRAYNLTGNNGVRYRVAGLPVDFMPFGSAVEEPDGVVVPAARREEMSVFGFQDVFSRAEPLVLPSGLQVRVPTTAGYVALKLRAWVDRSSYEDKDAQDLALAVEWYSSDEDIREELWDLVEDAVFLQYDSDTDLVAARLLGRRAAQVLTAPRARELATLLGGAPISANRFVASAQDRYLFEYREQRAAALTLGFLETANAALPPK